jgi:predicted phosphodiesterase
MRVFAVSDVHVEYDENARWIDELSTSDYTDDALILAGDVAESTRLLEWCLRALARRFRHVLFTPGNHDLWVRGMSYRTSLDKFARVRAIAAECRVSTAVSRFGPLSVVPLLGWYDYSFGRPTDDLLGIWMDYRACVWPDGTTMQDVTGHFAALNEPSLETTNTVIISFSHFLPRIDVMPSGVPAGKRVIYPVLGTTRLEEQIRRLGPAVHVYGHSHVNRCVVIDGIAYVNNALGYPAEAHITARRLACVHEI